jgi:hypothetical protein
MREFFDEGVPTGEQIPRHMEVVLTAEPGSFGETVAPAVSVIRKTRRTCQSVSEVARSRSHETLND